MARAKNMLTSAAAVTGKAECRFDWRMLNDKMCIKSYAYAENSKNTMLTSHLRSNLCNITLRENLVIVVDFGFAYVRLEKHMGFIGYRLLLLREMTRR